MYQFSYSEVMADDPVDARAQERFALDHAVTLLQQADAAPPHGIEEQEALSFVTQLWALFIKDLADPGNDLPAETRATLMSIGLWVIAEAQRIQGGASRGVGAIADVCRLIRDGLV